MSEFGSLKRAMPGRGRSLALALVPVLLGTVLALAAPAYASFELVDTFGEALNSAQEEERGLGTPAGMAIDESNGDLYILQQYEVLRFSLSGEFEGKLGYDVIQQGPDNSANDTRMKLTVMATGGTFKLGFGNKFKGVEQTSAETPSLPYNATTTEVEAALDALPTIGGIGGSVSVSGGPGDETGSNPYELTFKGAWGGDYLGEVGGTALGTAGQGLTGPEGATGIKAKVVTRGGGFENCDVAAGDVCKSGVRLEGPGAFDGVKAAGVDQSTGDLYVLTADEQGAIQVFSPNGALIATFGEETNKPGTPGQLGSDVTSLAVNSSGDVYVLNGFLAGGGTTDNSVTVFDPESPGDYEHYKYATDLFSEATYISSGVADLAFDPHDDLFIGNETELYEFEAGNFTTPTHEDHLRPSDGFTVDPESGDVFYYDEPAHKYRKIDPASGEQLEVFPGASGQENITGLAFNPAVKWENDSTRPAGLLYSVSDYSIESRKKPFGGIFSQARAHIKPRIVSESVAGIGSTSAALRASVDPSGYVTRYWFQYGTEDCSTHACAEAPLGGGELGSGQEALVAGVSLPGLRPDTMYHYRVLASNEFGTVEGPDQTFTTYPVLSAGLPDGRVYELVSPAFKDGGEVFPARAEAGSTVCRECTPGENSVPSAMQAAPGGGSVVYEGFPFAASGETVGYNEYLSTRTASGWQTRDLSPQLESPEGGSYPAFSSDLTQSVLWQPSGTPLSSEAPAGYFNLYEQVTSEGGSVRPLVTSEPQNEPALGLHFGGGSADFSHLVFAAKDALTQKTGSAPAAQYVGAGTSNVYEWVGGRLSLVNVLPGNSSSDPQAVVGAGDALKGTTEGGPDYSHAVSADGSRIFWSDAASGQVYVRENGETTLQVPDSGRFLTASPDGSRVVLNDGHIYDLQDESTTDLTGGQGGFQGIAGTSEDLSRIYFVDTAVLTGEQANGQGASAQSGAENLYEYDASGSGSTTFLATLTPSDGVSANGLTGDWIASPSDRTAQATPDGRYLAFVSTVSLTGYDNTTAAGSPVSEVYEYDSETGVLACASCGLVGVHPMGGATLGLVRPFGGGIFPQPRDVLSDGRVFFNSRTSLSPYDVNGLVQDVYEYEPVGVGSCGRQAGCVSLISRGIGGEDSEFVDASVSGSDVFFTTRDQLVSADQDDLEDLYDARVDGGFEELTAPACTGTGCQGVPGAPPIFATPSSVTFAGVGNFEQAAAGATGEPKPKQKTVKCAKAKTRVHGRCVKKKKVKRARKAGRTHKANSNARKARRRGGKGR